MNASIALPTIEDEGALAFQTGRRMKLYRPYGFAFCPYQQGTSQRINWLRGYQRIFEAVSR